MSNSAWERDLLSAARPMTTRQLAAEGVGKSALRGRKWRQVSRGFHVPAAVAPMTAGQRILEAATRLPVGSAIGGWAAAYTHGIDWMDGIDPHTGKDRPIDLVAPHVHRTSGPAIRYRASRLADADLTERSGVPVTTALRTAFDGARWAPDLTEAITFLDSMLAFPDASPGLLLESFRAYAAERIDWAGSRQARAAAELARPGVRSGWESRLRMCWLIEAGLPEPMINVPIFGPDQELLGIGDLFDSEAGVVAEFDGDHHRDPEQHRLDNIREERFESANLVVVRASKGDMRSERDRLVRRLTDARRRGELRDRRLDRWTLRQPAWWIARNHSGGAPHRGS